MKLNVFIVLALTFIKDHVRCSGSCSDLPRCLQCERKHCIKCMNGLYGPTCDLSCSPGCKNKTCEFSHKGTAPCTEGCEPGWYGSQCKIPCQSPGEKCQKCPSECEAGFCQLGSRCVSGCVDSYYGARCFTCGSDCHVCNKHTGRCYNCTADGCPFSSCDVQECQTTVQGVGITGLVDPAVTTGPPRLIIHWTVWVGAASLIVIILILLSGCVFCRSVRRHYNLSVLPVRTDTIQNTCVNRTRIHRKLSGRPSADQNLYSNENLQGGLSANQGLSSKGESGQALDDIYESDEFNDSLGSSFNDVYENV